MLTVILYHSVIFWSGNWFTVEQPVYDAKGLSVLAQWLNSFHIYAFTLTSGYLFHYLKIESGRYPGYRKFVANKVKRLIVPYVFTAIIWVIPISVYFYKYGIYDLLNKYVLAISPSQLWFLWMLFGVFVIFYPLSEFFENNTYKGMGLVCVLYLIGILGGKLLPNIFCIWTACRYIIFFWLGFKIRQGNFKICIIPWFWWFIADGIVFSVKVVFSIDGIWGMILDFVLNIIGSIAAFMFLQKLGMHIKWYNNRIWQLLSKCSMPMYLFHQQIIYFTIYWFNGMVNPFINAVINFTVSIVVSVFISRLLLKYRWTRYLVGEK